MTPEFRGLYAKFQHDWSHIHGLGLLKLLLAELPQHNAVLHHAAAVVLRPYLDQ